MNLTLRYTARNIKCNKLRVWMISLSVFIATLVFFFAFILPTLVATIKEDSMREFYGSSDIYIMPDLNSSLDMTLMGNLQMKNLYDNEEASDMFEYIVSFLALPGDISNDGAYILFGSVEDVNKFNPIDFYKISEDYSESNKVVISREYAEEKELDLGSEISIYILGEEAEFEVGGIAENSGLFSGINKEIILASKSAVAHGGPLYSFFGFIGTGINTGAYYFDLALFKVKEGVAIESAISTLESIYPKLNVSRTVDINLIDEIINSIMPLFLIGVAIICLFCGFILYFIAKMLVRDRATEFARLKCMGATNKHLIFSISLENFFYAVIGSIAGVALGAIILAITTPTALYSIGFQYYIYPFLCGIALSFIGIVLQSNRFFGSIKQAMISSDEKSIFIKLIETVLVLVNIASFIAIFLIPNGMRTTTIIIYVLLVLTTVYLSPIYFSLVGWLAHRIFHNKTFPSMYIRNSAATSHSPWLLRAITFGAITVMLLSVINSTFNNYMYALNATDDYNIKIAGVNGTNSSGFLNYFNTIDGVQKAYEGTVISTATIGNNTDDTITVYAYSDTNTEWLYSSYVDDTSIFDSITGTNKVLLGNYYNSILGYKIGDKIVINFDNTEEGSNHEFTISGFINNAKISKDIIADIYEVNLITEVNQYNNIYISADEEKINYILDEIKDNCLPSSLSLIDLSNPSTPILLLDNIQRSSEKTISMLGTAFVSITVLVIMIVITCVITNFMCFLIFLKEIRKHYFIFNTMGLSNRYLCNLLALQLLTYSFAGVFLSSSLIIPLVPQSENLIALSNLTMTITPSTWQLILIAIGYCISYVVFSWVFVPAVSKRIVLRDAEIFKLGQEKLTLKEENQSPVIKSDL